LRGWETVATDEGEISYSVLEGQPPWSPAGAAPIVLQHGIALSAEAWQPWLQVLVGPRPIVCIDLRGHGRSGAAWSSGREFPLTRFAADVAAVLDAIDAESCHFVGESFGGTIGLQLALDRPERVRSVTVCSTAFQGARIRNVSHWPELVQDRAGLESWSEELLTGRFEPDVDPDLRRWVEASQRAMAGHVVAGVVRSLLAADLSERLAGLAPPLQILVGIGSPFVSLDSARALHELVPSSEIAYLHGARHGIFLSHWRQCAEAARGFIERTASA
jgi:pimeloyl-ACP methyl ester carboxylesterase